ncbi:HAD-IC family P-type ATPase [Candidatus Woesebacteria bacterium]|nr:MAG: HAD-IC family P-type ATPase [Candidatus Woesebacteria bacterium]
MKVVAKGLSLHEAKTLLGKFGPNKLPEKKPPSSFAILASQFKSPLVYVLLAAGLVTTLLREFSDSLVILFVVTINTALGFLQEKKASDALTALKALVHPSALVVRDGKKQSIAGELIVPGDIVFVAQGNKVPADGKIVSANRLLVEEAILTGESMPVDKGVDDEVFMGTIVSSGEAYFKVTKTGQFTQIGAIAKSVQVKDDDTPLTLQLKKFSNQLTVLVIVLTVIVFIVGLISKLKLEEIFTTSVALAVSSIPEGLLIALTVVLAVGMQRILKNKGLVRNLVSAETLGGVTTICVDKTGTLTHGKLQVVNVHGDVDKICLQHFASSSDPIMEVAHDWIKEHSKHYEKIKNEFSKECETIDSIPFTPENRYYATLIEHTDSNREIYINGAPELLLKYSTLTLKEKKDIKSQIKSMTQTGRRVIGMAKKNVPDSVNKITEKDIDTHLEWIGLLEFTDPVRENLIHPFEEAKLAGIKTIVITGDYAETAISVMREIGIPVDTKRIVLGKELENMSESKVSEILRDYYEASDLPILFARTKPEQKLKVINALKSNGEVVAMMGDGVNDAPALHRSDIGIVVGDATDVAKESADLILLDSSFETIISAIKEGRGIFDNLRKIILYLMSDSFEEIVAVMGVMLLQLPLPVTAVQILWINLVSDGLPHLALTVDPKDPKIMRRKPRNQNENLVSPWMKKLIFTVSSVGGLSAFSLFVYSYVTTNDLIYAQSIAFATLGINSLVYVFSVRTLTDPFWVENPFNNIWLNLAVLGGIIFQIIPFIYSPVGRFLGIEPISLASWALVVGASLLMFLVIEFSKSIFRHHLAEV